jgi:hypothetical protein
VTNDVFNSLPKGSFFTMKLSILYSFGVVSLRTVLGSHDVYKDRASFDAALKSKPCSPFTEDFFSDTTLVGGVSFTSTTGFALVDTANGKFNDKFDFTEPSGTTKWTFADKSLAFGANFNLQPEGGSNGAGIVIDIKILLNGHDIDTLAGDYNGFWGVISDDEFESVEVTKSLSIVDSETQKNEIYDMDDLSFCNVLCPDAGCNGDPHFSTH